MKKAVAAGLGLLLMLVLLIAATGAAVGDVLTAPVNTASQALDEPVSQHQLDGARFCLLGKIRPNTPSGYGTFDTEQISNAAVISRVANGLGLPEYAAVIATATALQESSLRNLPYGDRDSLGLFQQRPSQGWGSAQQILNPAYAATRFYTALMHVPGWQTIPLYQAAQAVQRSGNPTAYQQWSAPATFLVATVSGVLDQCAVRRQ